MKKFAVLFMSLALALASAKTYQVTLFQDSDLGGTKLKAGEYKFDVQDGKVTVTGGAVKKAEVPLRVETNGTKYSSNTVKFEMRDGKPVIQEIRLGGTNTKLVAN